MLPRAPWSSVRSWLKISRCMPTRHCAWRSSILAPAPVPTSVMPRRCSEGRRTGCSWKAIPHFALPCTIACGGGVRPAKFMSRTSGLFCMALSLSVTCSNSRWTLQPSCMQLTLPDRVLLTASALLDLVSETWLRSLAQRAAQAAATVWFALTYDGSIDCRPTEPEDREVQYLSICISAWTRGLGRHWVLRRDP